MPTDHALSILDRFVCLLSQEAAGNSASYVGKMDLNLGIEFNGKGFCRKKSYSLQDLFMPRQLVLHVSHGLPFEGHIVHPKSREVVTKNSRVACFRMQLGYRLCEDPANIFIDLFQCVQQCLTSQGQS